jgi:hypothetical protein
MTAVNGILRPGISLEYSQRLRFDLLSKYAANKVALSPDTTNPERQKYGVEPHRNPDLPPPGCYY